MSTLDWENRPNRLKSTGLVGRSAEQDTERGNRTAGAQYNIGSYQVTVWYSPTVGEEPELTATHRYRYATEGDPRRILPNLEVQEGELRFLIEDLVPIILERLTPDELAASL